MELQFTLSTIHDAARHFWESVNGKKVFAFHGAMGAGKTTFIHALCDIKMVNSKVSSPTFALINEYSYPSGKIFHMDLYRLKDAEEAIRAGIEDSLLSGEICLVEWPERAESIFPDGTLGVFLSIIDPETRLLQIEDK